MPTLEGLTSWFRRSLPVGQGRKVAQLIRDENPQRYLDPAALARFGLSPMVARLVVEGFINGLHKSPFHGFSVEFADHREYVPGDDLKYIDWPLYARTDHYYIKRYEDQTNVRCHLLLDGSGSMAFGTGAITKWDYACFMSTCLAYMMMKQQDAVALTLMRDGPSLMLPARSRSSHLRQIMSVMIKNPPAGQTSLPAALRAAVRTIKRRSLVVLVSDLIDEPEETVAAIRLIGGHKHDVVVFHISDAAEREFFFEGPTLFHDMETGEELEVDPAAVRDAYLEKQQELQDFYQKGLSEAGVDYQPINTSQRYDQALSAYLRRRMRMGK